MAKLNKQEINAIANKVLRELAKNSEEAKVEAVKNYKPSEKYNELKLKLERLFEIRNIRDDLEKEAYILSGDINSLMAFEHNWIYTNSICNEATINKYLRDFIQHEVVSNPIPKLEELKEDITIAAIDENFNAEMFINSLIEKYNNYGKVS